MTITAESTTTIADRHLRSDVEDELDWDPAVPSTNIGVSVTDHAVTLSGTVHSLFQRLAAVKAARRVKDVHAIVDEIVVAPVSGHGATDQDIALAIERLLEHSSTVPAGVTATVRDGVVTLARSVSYQFQRDAAYKAARDIKGVSWVDNDIVITPGTSERLVRSRIVAAMHRNADLDSKNIQVVTTDHEVWLAGRTRSYAAKAQAELAAWSAPGVAEVHNHILVMPDT